MITIPHLFLHTLSYTTGQRFNVGDNVEIEQGGTVRRVVGTRQHFYTPSLFLLLVTIFPVVGLSIVLFYFFKGKKVIKLLQNGCVVWGTFMTQQKTGRKIRNKGGRIIGKEMQLQFQFVTPEGEKHEAVILTFAPDLLLNEKSKMLFYDPVKPNDYVFLDMLPGKVRFDETDNTFQFKIRQAVLPFLLCSLFLIESILTIVSIAIGDFFV